MPDSPSKLPPRPSLEQLKKQAKEHLEGMPGATLAEAQFALARQYGFESWAKLKHHVEAHPAAGLEQHEDLARDLVAVYRHDDAAAAERLNDLFHSALDTEQIRQFIKDRLITAFADGEARITGFGLPDAQLVVARLYGFDDWEGFVASSSRAEPEPARACPSVPRRRSIRSIARAARSSRGSRCRIATGTCSSRSSRIGN